MAMKRFDMVMPVELLARVDAVRGDASRALFVRRALESALGGLGPDQSTNGVMPGGPATAAPLLVRPAPSRASVSPSREAHTVSRPASPRYGPKRAVKPIPKST